MVKLKLSEGIELPKYETTLASGFDVIVNSIKKVFIGTIECSEEKVNKLNESFNKNGFIKLRPFERVLFGTGLTLADIDKSLEIQVRPRSGNTLKRGLLVQFGTIDADYRGECGIIIYNSTPYLNTVNKGEKLAQFVPACVPERPEITSVEDITFTDRGEGGFGSTSKNT